MVIDTSALVAILSDEPERQGFAEAIARDPIRLIDLDLLLLKLAARVVPFSADDISGVQRGYQRFGKGRHAASLNFGDCFAYALAVSTGEPLLFKGSDFSRTDVATTAWEAEGVQP